MDDRNMENENSRRPNFFDKSAQAVSKVNNIHNGYQNAKKLVKKGKENAEKYKAKKAEERANKKNNPGKKSPKSDSVKKKREQVKNRDRNNRNKKKNNKDNKKPNINTDELKKKVNEEAFKKTVSTAANIALPGAGNFAESLLKTPLGKKPIKAARNSSNPLMAVKNGAEKLIQIVKNIKTKVKLSVSSLSVLVTVLVIVVIVLGISSKFMDSQNYFGKGNANETEMDPKYAKFYENLKKHGGTNQAMVLSVLTAYKDNDIYTDEDDLNNTVDSCTEEEISSGECFEETDESGISKYSKSKMKKYIKKVAKAISDSGGDIEEGDYSDPENTGSEFFQWLYTDFVDDYYSEYLDNAGDNLAKKKEEIIHFIYLYYESLEHETCISSAGGYETSCDFNLTTVEVLTCDGNTKMEELSLKEYLLGVTLAEIDDWGDDENTFKAFVIVAKTYSLNRDSYDSNTKKISLRSCTKDQVWCDIENGCNRREYTDGDGTFVETYSKAYSGISEGSNYKSPLSAERKQKWSKWYDEVSQYLYLDRNKYTGPITSLSGNPIGYYNDQQEYWYKQSTLYNKSFEEVFAGTDSATDGSEYFHFDSLGGEDLGLYDLGSYCSKISGGTTVAGEYIYYSQSDEPWASELHGCGSGKLFKNKGCFQTSMAMILSNLLGKEITPSDTNLLAANNKSSSCSGGTSYASFFDVAAKAYGLTRTTYQNKTSSSARQMLTELSKGNLIIQLLKCNHVSDICPTAFGGHAVVIVPGTKEGFVTVLDPGRSIKTWEVTAYEATGSNTQGWFSSFSLNSGTMVSDEIDSNNSNLITTGALSNACTYTP